MRFNYIRGFRRLGRVLAVLCLPVIFFVAYQESQEFAGFSKEKLATLYPKLKDSVSPNEAIQLWGKSPNPTDDFIPDFTAEDAIAVLTAERNGTIEPWNRYLLGDLRNRNQFPYAWEVEVKALNKIKFAGLVVLIETGIIVFFEGSITLLAWILRGFIKEA